MAKDRVFILGIETSCDETAAAVVEDGRVISSNLVLSQIDLHSRFGGVVPEIASRHHLETLNPLIDSALEEAGVGVPDLSALAVSHGPGLVGALLVGVATAKALAFAWGLPLLAVNHLEGHLYANFLTGADITFPFMGLVASGGHTDLVWVPREGELKLLGETRDDAAGEAFDKVARALGLGYPGGPVIDRLAREGNPEAVKLPRAYLDEAGRFDFSFSGLKSAVLNYLNHLKQQGKEVNIPDLAAGFQAAVVDVLVEKTAAAVKEYGPSCLVLSGGVAANSSLRARMKERISQTTPNVPLHYPPPELCTDNAAMIAAAAYPRFLRGESSPLDLNAIPGLRLQ